MENVDEEGDSSGNEKEEEELTILLRLRPAPTPPQRRKKNTAEPRNTTPKGWDVIVEHQELDCAITSSPLKKLPPISPLSPRRHSLDFRATSACVSPTWGVYLEHRDESPPGSPRRKRQASPGSRRHSLDNKRGTNSGPYPSPTCFGFAENHQQASLAMRETANRGGGAAVAVLEKQTLHGGERHFVTSIHPPASDKIAQPAVAKTALKESAQKFATGFNHQLGDGQGYNQTQIQELIDNRTYSTAPQNGMSLGERPPCGSISTGSSSNFVDTSAAVSSAFTQLETRKPSQANTLNTRPKNNQCLGESKAVHNAPSDGKNARSAATQKVDAPVKQRVVLSKIKGLEESKPVAQQKRDANKEGEDAKRQEGETSKVVVGGGVYNRPDPPGSGGRGFFPQREDNFENAVKDFDLTAEDVQKFVFMSRAQKSDKTDSNGKGCVVLKNHQFEVEKGGAARPAQDFLGRASDGFRSDSSDDDTSSDSDGEDLKNDGLETITEEDRVTASSLNSTGADSSSPEDDSTVKGNGVAPRWGKELANHDGGSTSDISSSSSGDDDGIDLKDSSTRCNSDFQWIRKDMPKQSPPKMEEQIPQNKPPISRSSVGRETKPSRRSAERTTAPGSLDRRRPHHQNRHERDQKSRSTHVMKSPSPRLDDYMTQGCQGWCCNPYPNGDSMCFDTFHRRHERMDPQRYGSSPMLMEQRFGERGSHPDLYSDCNRYRHDPPPPGSMGMGCYYHMPPPCCCFGDGRGYHWTPPPLPKGPEQDERLRKIQNERDNLQLQVQVLGEQIEAQTDKISDLEKSLSEKKQLLANAEDLLQREMLSRSSLETQKLELMSAMSELKLQHASLEREIMELKSSQVNNNSSDSIKKPGYIPRMSPQPQLTSTPVHHSSNQALNVRMTPSPGPVTTGGVVTSPRRVESATPLQQEVQTPKTPPASYRRQIELHYASLPRQQFLSNGGSSFSVVDSNANPANSAAGRRGVAFGRGLSTLLGGRARGHSVPNLAETEKIVVEDPGAGDAQSPTLQFNKNKGIKKILGKMKRSGSGNLDDLPGLGEFQRGGVRATAAARLGWSEPQIVKKPDKPFAEWDTEDVCTWLEDLGLDQYIQEAKRWVKNGQQLQEASIGEIEKELNVKNPLHKKKLQLAIIDTQENSSSDPYLTMAGQLDTSWVLRWLDDTGLPQHKETFLINRIDGRVLHRLTMDDLALLHVTSLLHVASLKRGIQVLRENNYEPGCLTRRSLPDDPPQPTPKQISLWTTHRVMEWLRAVDLAEYAPNLRGAGVHGGLMVLENKFTAELLATLLSIPPGKTLLRRHLNTHFKELLGKDTIQAKREAEGTLGYIPLTPSSKLKVPKKSHFSLKRNKSKGEADYGDLVCPLNSAQSGDQNGTALNMGTTRMADLKEEDACLLDNYSLSGSYPQSASNSPLLQRHED